MSGQKHASQLAAALLTVVGLASCTSHYEEDPSSRDTVKAAEGVEATSASAAVSAGDVTPVSKAKTVAVSDASSTSTPQAIAGCRKVRVALLAGSTSSLREVATKHAYTALINDVELDKISRLGECGYLGGTKAELSIISGGVAAQPKSFQLTFDDGNPAKLVAWGPTFDEE